MTRITQSMMTNHLMSNMYNVLGIMDKTNEQLSSMSKVNRPSDDPLALARIMRIRTGLSENDQYSKNISYAKTWQDITDTAMGEVSSALQRAKELSVQAAHGGYDADQRAAIGQEIDQILEHLVDIGNTSYQGKYIFGGYRSNSTPYELTSKGANFPGNTGSVITEISKGVYLDYNLANNRAFILGDTEADYVESESALGELKLNAGYTHPELASEEITVRVSGIDDDGNALRVQVDFGDGLGNEIAVKWPDPKNKTYPINIDVGNNMTFTLSGTSEVGDLHKFTMDAKGEAIEIPVVTVMNENSGAAIAAFRGVGRSTAGYTFQTDDQMLFNFAIGEDTYSIQYKANTLGETTANIAATLNQSELKDIMTFYGAGDTPPWYPDGQKLGAGELVFSMDGESEYGNTFDFWVSNVKAYDQTTGTITEAAGTAAGFTGNSQAGGLHSSMQVYSPKNSFMSTDGDGPHMEIVTGGAVVNTNGSLRTRLTEALYMKDANGELLPISSGSTLNYTVSAGVTVSATYSMDAAGNAWIDYNFTGIAAGTTAQMTYNDGGGASLYDAIGNIATVQKFSYKGTSWSTTENHAPYPNLTEAGGTSATLTFGENLFFNSDGTGAVTAGDISANFAYVSTSGTSATFTVTYNDTVAGSAELQFDITGGTPVKGDTIQIKNGVKFYDQSGNQWEANNLVFDGTNWCYTPTTQVSSSIGTGVSPYINPNNSTEGMLVGNYDVAIAKIGDTHYATTSSMEYSKSGKTLVTSSTAAADQNLNISLKMEVTDLSNPNPDSVEFTYEAYIMDGAGNITTANGTIVLTAGATTVGPITIGGFTFSDITLEGIQNFSIGDKVVINGQSFDSTVPNENVQQVSIQRDDETLPDMQFSLDAGFFSSSRTSHRFKFFQLNEESGTVRDASVALSFSATAWDGSKTGGLQDAVNSASVTMNNVASFDVKMPAVMQERDIFAVLSDFRDALNADDNDGITLALDEIQQAYDNAVWCRSAVGAKTNRLEFAESRLTDNNYALERLSSKLQDIDLAQTIMDFQMQQNVYQAILSTGASIIQPTLMDFLR